MNLCDTVLVVVDFVGSGLFISFSGLKPINGLSVMELALQKAVRITFFFYYSSYSLFIPPLGLLHHLWCKSL